MSLRHALLGALADEPRTGYSLLKHFHASLASVWPASHSQIYPELARLRAEGLIRQASTGPRGSKIYELTDKGLFEVRRWLREEDPDHSVRNEAALRIFFLWLLEPREAAAYLDREAEYYRGVLEEVEAIAEEEDEADCPKRLAPTASRSSRGSGHRAAARMGRVGRRLSRRRSVTGSTALGESTDPGGVQVAARPLLRADEGDRRGARRHGRRSSSAMPSWPSSGCRWRTRTTRCAPAERPSR